MDSSPTLIVRSLLGRSFLFYDVVSCRAGRHHWSSLLTTLPCIPFFQIWSTFQCHHGSQWIRKVQHSRLHLLRPRHYQPLTSPSGELVGARLQTGSGRCEQGQCYHCFRQRGWNSKSCGIWTIQGSECDASGAHWGEKQIFDQWEELACRTGG